MGTTVSLSSPEPEERNVVERAWHILCQKPLRIGSMLRLSRVMNDASPQEKILLVSSGVVQRILDMIDERSHVTANSSTTSKRTHGQSSPQANNGQQSLQASGSGSGTPQKSPLKAPRNNFVTQITTGGRRKSNAYNIAHRGIGYGFGSTRSHWDIERTIEEQLAREEQLVWLMNALTAYIFCANPDFQDVEDVRQMANEKDQSHVTPELVSILDGSSIVPMLQYHLKNESIFDISEHMEFYQSLLELASSMCLYPSLAELLVYAHDIGHVTGDAHDPTYSKTTNERSVCLHLLPRFRDQLLTYLSSPTVRMGSPDFRLLDFIQRVQKWSEMATSAAKNTVGRSTKRQQASLRTSARMTRKDYTDDVPSDTLTPKGVEGAMSSSSSGLTVSSSNSSTIANELPHAAVDDSAPAVITDAPDVGECAAAAGIPVEPSTDFNSSKQATDYTNALKNLQINTWKFIGDFGKLVVPFMYRKEAKSLNPFSPSLKERTKRIARELASLHNSLPLNWSNSIFIAVDEGRCDIMKVLITGPEDTPYQNGCFEFDLFFPAGYPFSPPKVSFLTTGNGEVRFNPNLYQDGKVCLSILNTWEGRPEEKWNPYCSVLQVLVSVQALIFVKEPYFNEPGFERYVGTEKGQHLSNAYNQQLQHATLHYAILEQLKQPPEYFKDVIRRHFFFKKDTIREQAHKWLRVAQADAAAFTKEKDNKKGGSSSSMAAAAAAALDSGLGVVSVRGMERTVELLDQELAQLTCQDH